MQRRRLTYRSIWEREAWRQLWHCEKKAGPVKRDPRTLYPNVLAELEASGVFMCTVRGHIQVSQEILWAVMEDGEPLTEGEMRKLANLFECRSDYLRAPTLQIVYMESNRGKFRRAMLGAMLQRIPPMPGEDFYTEVQRERAAEVYQAMESGNPVTYAAWHWAMSRCEYVMQKQRWTASKPRTARLA